MKKTKLGRPTAIKDNVLLKLEEAFALGCTDLEACSFAGIGKTALYAYQEKNPDFTERKEALKANPVLQARKTVMDAITTDKVKGLKGDPELALKFLERKAKAEFAPRQEHSGPEGRDLYNRYNSMSDEDAHAEAIKLGYVTVETKLPQLE